MAKPKYNALDYDDEDTVISDAVAFTQAARALDVAATEAVQCHDRETLVNVAALWLKMAEVLLEPAEAEEEPEVHEPAKLGFTVDTGKEEDEHTED